MAIAPFLALVGNSNRPCAFQTTRASGKPLATKPTSYYKGAMKLQLGKKLLILGSASLLIAATVGRLPGQTAQQHQHDGAMPGMNMDDDSGNHAEAGAMRSMEHGHHMDSAHMQMTPVRPATAEDRQRADQIAVTLGEAIEKYRDYRVALAEGYRIFMPNLPQAQYHFTNYWNGFLEGFTFDPARPTSLLYRKTKDGYELSGAMYTAPRTASLEELDERIPLGVARWHQHTNLCMPKRDEMSHADWKKFGLTGSISTEQECKEAGGRFYPLIFGWMVHVYPFESSPAKIWAQ
jgi:hypothetical protein